MAGRSLRTSDQGIARAKRALLRKNLTQKAIANELGIASWSTVSKFFNGKPVDRLLFMEICHALDLDWSEVVASPDLEEDADARDGKGEAEQVDSQGTPEDDGAPLSAVQEQAAIARDALTPRILERIPRDVVRRKYLPAIARGVADKKPRVISIIGPAGYGKSTILGDLYDELTAVDTAWVGLILCSSLSTSSHYLSYVSYSVLAATFAPPSSAASTTPTTIQDDVLIASFGKSLCGQSRPVTEVASELHENLGRGVLLIDTLDLVANREFIRVFSQILRELVATGVTVVFTCRDREYSDYLEPTRERLAGLSHAVDSYTVPNFSAAEIRQAATAFFRKRDPAQAQQGERFAENILNLSADNRSLQEIIENPLLLALLCDLFAAEGNVPPDLTVSKLYQRYWQEKIAYTRLDRRDAQLLAMEKEKLCLAIARQLFQQSQDRLCESIYRDELEVSFTELAVDAYNDLLSEGVLTLLPSGKLHFFHQTLLEYAIAYWLTRHTAQPQRDRLFESLNQTDDSFDSTYWLPVVRQLLTIVDTEAEFEQWMAELNTEDLGIFGAVCMAAASRDSPAALRQLLPTALELGEAYQKRLRQAFGVASRQLIVDIWDVLLLLLETESHATAGNTAQLVGDLMARWWRQFHVRLPEAIGAIARRQPDPNAPGHFREGDGALLSGWLLQPCLEFMEQQPDAELLNALHPYLNILGYRTFAALIQLHIITPIASDIQWQLLEKLLNDPVPDHDAVGRALCDWLTHLLDRLESVSASTPLGLTLTDLLHRSSPERWDKVQARAIGTWAAQDSSRLRLILDDLLYGPSHRLEQNHHALSTSIEEGASSLFIGCLTAIKSDPSEESPQPIYALSKLLTRCVPHLSNSQQEELVDWLSPRLEQQMDQFFRALDALADQSLVARELLMEHLPHCSVDKQAQIRLRLLRFQPVEQHPPLDTVDKSAQRFLISVYRQQAQTDLLARDRLLAAAQGRKKDIAVAASNDIAKILEDSLTVGKVTPLLRSPFQGVRANAVEALIYQINCTRLPNAEEFDEVGQILSGEDNQTVIRLLFNLINGWARQNQPIPPHMLSAISTLPSRLVAKNLFDGGTARSLLDALKAMAQSTAPPDTTALNQATQHLLISINLGQLRNGESEMIDLLCAIHRLNASFLSEMMQQQGAAMAQHNWRWNLSAIIKTIERVEGQTSLLLTQILASEWCTPMVSDLILETRMR